MFNSHVQQYAFLIFQVFSLFPVSPELFNTGWWYTYPSEKYEFVSWDDYSQLNGSHEIHVPNHQPEHSSYDFPRSSPWFPP